MVTGRGFVRSGSGFVSTPATRRAARMTGTFGGEGYAGAAQTAAQILCIQRIEARKEAEARAAAEATARVAREAEAAAAAPCPEGNEFKATYPNLTCPIGYWQDIRSDGLWCVCGMWKSRVPTPPPEAPPEAPPEENCLAKCAPLAGIPIAHAACITLCEARTPPTPPTTPPPTPPPTPPTTPGKCTRGNRYTPDGLAPCDSGYHEVWEGWFPSRNRYCICDFAPPEEEGELGDLGKYTPLLLGAAAALIFSLIKR